MGNTCVSVVKSARWACVFASSYVSSAAFWLTAGVLFRSLDRGGDPQRSLSQQRFPAPTRSVPTAPCRMQAVNAASRRIGQQSLEMGVHSREVTIRRRSPHVGTPMQPRRSQRRNLGIHQHRRVDGVEGIVAIILPVGTTGTRGHSKRTRAVPVNPGSQAIVNGLSARTEESLMRLLPQ